MRVIFKALLVIGFSLFCGSAAASMWGTTTYMDNGKQYTYQNDNWWFIFTMASCGVALIFSVHDLAKRASADRAAENAAAAKVEEERLRKIRVSMTPAEWELYQVQAENQRLLKELKAQGEQFKPTFGVFKDMSD